MILQTTSACGYPLFVLSSLLQKTVRQCDTKAMAFALAFFIRAGNHSAHYNFEDYGFKKPMPLGNALKRCIQMCYEDTHIWAAPQLRQPEFINHLAAIWQVMSIPNSKRPINWQKTTIKHLFDAYYALTIAHKSRQVQMLSTFCLAQYVENHINNDDNTDDFITQCLKYAQYDLDDSWPEEKAHDNLTQFLWQQTKWHNKNRKKDEFTSAVRLARFENLAWQFFPSQPMAEFKMDEIDYQTTWDLFEHYLLVDTTIKETKTWLEEIEFENKWKNVTFDMHSGQCPYKDAYGKMKHFLTFGAQINHEWKHTFLDQYQVIRIAEEFYLKCAQNPDIPIKKKKLSTPMIKAWIKNLNLSKMDQKKEEKKHDKEEKKEEKIIGIKRKKEELVPKVKKCKKPIYEPQFSNLNIIQLAKVPCGSKPPSFFVQQQNQWYWFKECTQKASEIPLRMDQLKKEYGLHSVDLTWETDGIRGYLKCPVNISSCDQLPTREHLGMTIVDLAQTDLGEPLSFLQDQMDWSIHYQELFNILVFRYLYDISDTNFSNIIYQQGKILSIDEMCIQSRHADNWIKCLFSGAPKKSTMDQLIKYWRTDNGWSVWAQECLKKWQIKVTSQKQELLKLEYLLNL